MNNFKRELSFFIEDGINNFGSIKNKKTLIKQIPNLLTLLRLLLLPFVLINLFYGYLITAGIITIISVTTDLFDGIIARKCNAVTKFGAKFDALADKTFAVTVMIALAFTNSIIILPIVLDITIGVMNSIFVLKGKDVKTSRIGKIKTLFLDALICSLFFTNYNIDILINILFVFTILLQMLSIKRYFRKYKKTK